jgi:hypothetical protein
MSSAASLRAIEIVKSMANPARRAQDLAQVGAEEDQE